MFSEVYPTTGRFVKGFDDEIVRLSYYHCVEHPERVMTFIRKYFTFLKNNFPLELTDPGFDHSVLSEFRSRLLEGHAEERMPGSPPGAMSGGRMEEAPEDDNGPTKPMYSASIRALNRTLRVAQTMVSVLHVRVAR
jgi:hypothetical protein